MRLSKTKIYSLEKVDRKSVISTSDLLEKSGYIKQVQSGLYVQMNLMKRLINNIEKIVKQELENVGCLEISLNQLQTAEIWKQTGRFDTYGSEMFKLKDRSEKEVVFTGTNEELVTLIAKSHINSYRDLSFTFYQINNKFRDEIRCNAGLIRCKEFLMMDAYSFHKDIEDLKQEYENIRQCYVKIFDRLGLKYKIEKADSGEIGGSVSEEFIVETSEGAIEIGHIFQLDTKYSEKMECQYVDENNVKQNVFMGCYGIGLSRLAQVLADVNRIDNNFNFVEGLSAYDFGIVIGNVNDQKQVEEAEKLYQHLLSLGKSVYLDDRDLRIGQKLMEIDSIGIANKVLIGNNVKEGYYETKKASNDSWLKIKID